MNFDPVIYDYLEHKKNYDSLINIYSLELDKVAHNDDNFIVPAVKQVKLSGKLDPVDKKKN